MGFVLAAFVLGAMWLLATPMPASADDCDPDARATQDDLRDYPAHCRAFIVDPGVGELHDQESLSQAWEKYENYDLSPNFIWYGERTTITVESDDVRWTYCLERHDPSVELCPVGVDDTTVLGSFPSAPGDSVVLDVIAYEDMWIALVCGNWRADIDQDAPVPTIPIEKFIDLNRNGTRDPGEPSHSGVRFTVHRISSEVGQNPGPVGSVTTNAAGKAIFRLDGEGPGVYEIREQVPAGYYSTTGTTRTVTVGFDGGAKQYRTQVFGNGLKTVDVEKLTTTIELPGRIDARQPFVVDVPVTIVNNGPADYAKVIDRLTLEGRQQSTGEIDCVVTPLNGPFEATLRINQPVQLRFKFEVTCETPSDHVFTAIDTLDLDDSPLMETNLDNNVDDDTENQPVWAETDLTATTAVDCPARTDVDVAVDCTVTTTVTNDGFGPIATTTTVELSGLADCTIDDPARIHQIAAMADGSSETFVDVYRVACADRSFHPFTATALVDADDKHVEELNESDNGSTAEDTIEVFEEAELAVTDLDVLLACNEYFESDPFSCSATAVVTNAGPADQVIADVTLDLVADGCTADPNPQLVDVVIAAGSSVDVGAVWSVSCVDSDALHVLKLEVCIQNDDEDDPHAEDRNLDNNCADVVALPIDLKPLSDPNTLLLGRGGVTSVAILSTDTFNPILEVDTSQPVYFGPTGTEAAATRCATEGEDANKDGYDQDLVCLFRVKDLNLTTDVEYLYLTGRLADGTRFIGTDQVRVIDRAA